MGVPLLVLCSSVMVLKRGGVFVLETRGISGDARHLWRREASRLYRGGFCLCFPFVSCGVMFGSASLCLEVVWFRDERKTAPIVSI